MSYIPDVRSKTILLRRGMAVENPYYEGNLDEQGKQFLATYDICMEDVETFFLCLDEYREELLEAGFDPYLIDDSVMAANKDLDEYSREELRNMTKETRVALAIGNALLQRMEANRNEFVVTMLDGQGYGAEDGTED